MGLSALGLAAFMLGGVLLAACSAGTSGAGHGATSLPKRGVPKRRTDATGTVWLCRPGLAPDPCTTSREATSVAADGSTTGQPAPLTAAASRFDCFYLYPTVSTETTDNADLTIQPVEREAARAQASRFSSVCRVWAPMYRQRTAASLAKGLGSDPAGDAVAYASVLLAWQDYLAHDNDGRPVIFIGHSQGAAMLIRLLHNQIDPDPALRKRMVSAIILGGNVQVPTGATVGGSFAHIPACTSATQTSCVIAYSSFPARPPKQSLFGRPGQGVSLQSGQTATTGMQVLCTNPADLAGGRGPLDPYFPSPSSSGSTSSTVASSASSTGASVATPWVTYPDLYTAQCQSAGGATWFQITDIGGADDARPRATETLGPTWGLHLDDVNLALGNLVAIVSTEEAAFGSG
jgi:hypothetical protein